MAIPSHRIMTMKSKLGSGKYADYRLKTLFELSRESEILKAYFTITNVDFDEEVSSKLNLGVFKLEKPSSDYKMFKQALEKLYPSQFRRIFNRDPKSKREKDMTRSSKLSSKLALQYKNQKS